MNTNIFLNYGLKKFEPIKYSISYFLNYLIQATHSDPNPGPDSSQPDCSCGNDGPDDDGYPPWNSTECAGGYPVWGT